MINMFCLYHFSLKCIIKNLYLISDDPLKVCIGSRAPDCRTEFKIWQDHTPKHLPRSDQSWNTRQDLKIPSLREAALETERRFFSKVILESNVTPNITRSSDSFSTVTPIVNGGDWGCIVRDLETIIVLVRLAIKVIPQRSLHSLALPRTRTMLPQL